MEEELVALVEPVAARLKALVRVGGAFLPQWRFCPSAPLRLNLISSQSTGVSVSNPCKVIC
jgi:hypothetical protein